MGVSMSDPGGLSRLRGMSANDDIGTETMAPRLNLLDSPLVAKSLKHFASAGKLLSTTRHCRPRRRSWWRCA